MATFSDYAKNIFWVLLILQFAPTMVRSIRQQYTDLSVHKTKVGVFTINGPLLSITTQVRDLKKLFDDPEIKAIVLKIDSPGGNPPTFQTIYNEINHYKSLYPSKYIVGLVETVAASGGYYAVCPAHYIIASPSALIGSIGAYVQHPYFKEFIEYHKIKYEIIKSGAYKGQGNPLLALTPEQRTELQGVSDDIYRQFLRDVLRERPHLPANNKLWADGRIFTGEQALALKLIDEVGSPATVERVLRDHAHIDGKIEYVKPPKKQGIFASLFSSESGDDDTSVIKSFVNSFCDALETRYSTKVSC